MLFDILSEARLYRGRIEAMSLFLFTLQMDLSTHYSKGKQVR